MHWPARLKMPNDAYSKRQIAERKGRKAEALAILCLRLKGYRILAQRVRNARGEIDIVARKFRTISFIEVKSRNKSSDLAYAIDAYKMRRVVAAAQACAHEYRRDGDMVRFDVILIAPRKWPQHLKNIWHDM